MKHYSEMSDEELGSEVYGRHIDAANTSTLGASIRRMLDSMAPDELAAVKDEVDRTARVVTALAMGRTFWITQNITDGETPYVQALAAEESRLIVLRTRQRALEADRAQKGGAK